MCQQTGKRLPHRSSADARYSSFSAGYPDAGRLGARDQTIIAPGDALGRVAPGRAVARAGAAGGGAVPKSGDGAGGGAGVERRLYGDAVSTLVPAAEGARRG